MTRFRIINNYISRSHQLLADVGLDNVHPLGNLHLAGLLEVSGHGHYEVLLGHVLHADRRHDGCSSEIQNANNI